MASRKDQLQSYQFMLQRTISALVMRETDPAQSPLRRGVGAAFGGVMVTVIVAATFGIYGLLTKTGSADWRVDNAVVVEKETGAAFVYANGTLSPALNYGSALLIAGQTPPKTFAVPANSLVGVPRGLARGIPGAPSSLPVDKHVLTGPWTICALPAVPAASTTLAVGTALKSGQPLGDQALYVRDQVEGGQFLVWHAHRYRLSGATVPTALFASGTPPTDVGSAWLNAIPEGDPIGDIPVAHAGTRSGQVPGHRVGDVLADRRDTGEVDYLVLDDGLARLTALQMDLLRARRPVTPQTASTAEIAAATKSDRLGSHSPTDQQPPDRTPRLAGTTPKSGLCATFSGRQSGSGGSSLLILPDGGTAPVGTPTGGRTKGGLALADRVAVPGGSVAVARALETGTYSLVTDAGVRFPVDSAATLGTLGYGTGEALTLPTAVLDRLPTGPALTHTAALELATTTTGH